VNAAVVSKQFDCSGERFKEKAARKQLRVAVAQRLATRDKKSRREWRAFFLARKLLVRNKIIASGGRVRA
jgi:hypothetical protein